MNIIGLSGVAGAGKDTVADILARYGYTKIALADPMKRICKEVFDFTDEQLWGPSEERSKLDSRFKGIPHSWGPVISGLVMCHRCGTTSNARFDSNLPGRWHIGVDGDTCSLTPRYALQLLGTEWGRHVYPDVWIDVALRTAVAVLTRGFRYDREHGLSERMYNPPKGVVIPDVRFHNELRAIMATGGNVWRIVRPTAGLVGAAAVHTSETELDDRPKWYSKVIDNTGTLDALPQLVRHALLDLP